MKKQTYAVVVAVLLAALLAFAGVAQSAMWVGAELGGNFPTSPAASVQVDGTGLGGAGFATSVIGGAIIGYDFVNSGFGAYAWPDWMKYFSIATDITYNRLQLNSLGGHDAPAGLNGYCVAWTFLFMGHYGLFPDSIVPSGRVNPYLGVGPAIVWSGVDFTNIGLSMGSATNVALVVEPGIRWMAFPNVSIDTAFRFRSATPSYDTSGGTLKINPLHQFTFLVRANYHF
jgi:opacity protein-like surface antigen